MIRVYICMQYGDDQSVEVREERARAAMHVWHRLANAGLWPFCPHLTHFLHEYRARDRRFWMGQVMAWIEPCDCVLVQGIVSKGMTEEIAHARGLRKPVFMSLGELSTAYGVEV